MTASITIHPASIERMAEASINNICWIGGHEVYAERAAGGHIRLTARPSETARSNENILKRPRYKSQYRGGALSGGPDVA